MSSALDAARAALRTAADELRALPDHELVGLVMAGQPVKRPTEGIRTAAPRPPLKEGSTLGAVLGYLETHGGGTGHEISTNLGQPKKLVAAVLSKLASQGRLRKPSKLGGAWTLP